MKQWRLYLVMGVFIIGSACSYGWFIAAERLEQDIFTHIARFEKEGHYFAHDGIRVSGFPFFIKVKIFNPQIKTKTPSIFNVMVDGPVVVRASVFNRQKIKIKTTHPITINLASFTEDDDWAIKSSGLKGQCLLNQPLTDHIKFTLYNLNFRALRAHQLSFAVKTNRANLYKHQYSLLISEFGSSARLFPGFSQIIQEIYLNISITEPFNIEESLLQSLKNWSLKQGVIEVTEGRLYWDNLKIKSNGTLTVNNDLQPMLAFAAEIYGLDTLLDTLSAQGYLKKKLATLIKLSLSLVKEVKKEDNRLSHYHKVGITLQDGEVVIGSIPIVNLGIFDWQTLNWNKVGVENEK